MKPLVAAKTQNSHIQHRVVAAVLSMNQVVDVEVPGCAAASHHASEVIAVEHLAADRCGDRRGHAGDLVALEIADVLGVAGQARRGGLVDRESFARPFDEALLARLAGGDRGLHGGPRHVVGRGGSLGHPPAQDLDEVVVGEAVAVLLIERGPGSPPQRMGLGRDLDDHPLGDPARVWLGVRFIAALEPGHHLLDVVSGLALRLA